MDHMCISGNEPSHVILISLLSDPKHILHRNRHIYINYIIKTVETKCRIFLATFSDLRRLSLIGATSFTPYLKRYSCAQ